MELIGNGSAAQLTRSQEVDAPKGSRLHLQSSLVQTSAATRARRLGHRGSVRNAGAFRVYSGPPSSPGSVSD